MKIVAFSDTHNHHRDVTLPDGDVLVFAGDLMTCGRKFNEVVSFSDWFMSQPHKHKILVAGNHDRLFETQRPLCVGEFHNRGSVYYLQDSSITIDGVKFWGSPVQPWFYNWAFNVQRGPDIKKYWDRIPQDTDVLITHGPPYGILDQTIGWGGEHVGCEELWKTVHDRLSLKAHIFGHIHNGYGVETKPYSKMVSFHNVSICDEEYRRANEPQVIEL